MVDYAESKRFYKKDKSGAIRLWRQEVEKDPETGEVFLKTFSGVVGGKIICNEKQIRNSTRESAFERACKLMDNNEIKKDREGYHKSIALAEADSALPFRPMKASTHDKSYISPMFSMQPKKNGCRSMFHKGQGTSISKGGLSFSVPHIDTELVLLAEILGTDIDGELYKKGLTSPEISGSATNSDNPNNKDLRYHIFDIPTNDSFDVRWRNLAKAVEVFTEKHGKPRFFQLVQTIQIKDFKEAKIWHDHWLKMGEEGSVIRLHGHGYEWGTRSKKVLKWKECIDQEFPVVHITYERRLHQGVMKYLVEFHCKCDAGTFPVVPAWDVDRRYKFYLDHKDKDAKEVIANLLPLRVQFREWTKNGFPFHAVGIDFRDTDI